MGNEIAKKRAFSVLVITAILISVLIFSLILVQNNQDIRKKAFSNNVSLQLTPDVISINPGDSFTVSMMINTGDYNVSAVEVHLIYNPALVEVERVSAGSYLPVVLSPGKYGKGAASIILGSKPNVRIKGVGVLGFVVFKALAPSASGQISFGETSQVAALGRTGNVLTNRNGTQVTIRTQVSPTAPLEPDAEIAKPSSSPSITGTMKDLSWQECIETSGSRVLMTYPETCVTPDGRRAVRP